jgi:hypothetical protein
MEMYLAAVPVYTIMLIGRWSSDAFLQYIRKQDEQFSKDVTYSPNSRIVEAFDFEVASLFGR